MALQTSGAIPLNDIHVEAGGSSGTQVSINDSDVRGLIGKASGATMSFSEWYGASAALSQFTMTTGFKSGKILNEWGYGPDFGSVTSTTTGITGSADDLYGLRSLETQGEQAIELLVNGIVSNSGFTSITIGSDTYLRSNAAFRTDTNLNVSIWRWQSGVFEPDNPFKPEGQVFSVTIE